MNSTHEALTVDSIASHLRSRPALAQRIDADDLTSVREVGDGNLNLVFVIGDGHGQGVVLKQSLPYVRVDPTWPITLERARFEAQALAAHGAAAPTFTPALYDFDAARFILAIEDLSDHDVWRTALNHGESHEGAAADLGTYVAEIAFATSAFGTDPLVLKEKIAQSVNPALCQITEDLVFTEPFITHEHNRVLAANEPDVAELVNDVDVRREIGRAKWIFMTRTESLIHGDLHTGSVMVRQATATEPRSTKAFDSEFAFYGPLAFDLGAVWANLVLAAARAIALGEDERAQWLLAQPAHLWDGFETRFRQLWPTRLDPRIWGEEVLDSLLAQWRSESATFAAAKATRRIIGFAKVSDIESLPEHLRSGAARGTLRAARILLLDGRQMTGVTQLNQRVGTALVESRSRA